MGEGIVWIPASAGMTELGTSPGRELLKTWIPAPRLLPSRTCFAGMTARDLPSFTIAYCHFPHYHLRHSRESGNPGNPHPDPLPNVARDQRVAGRGEGKKARRMWRWPMISLFFAAVCAGMSP